MGRCGREEPFTCVVDVGDLKKAHVDPGDGEECELQRRGGQVVLGRAVGRLGDRVGGRWRRHFFGGFGCWAGTSKCGVRQVSGQQSVGLSSLLYLLNTFEVIYTCLAGA